MKNTTKKVTKALIALIFLLVVPTAQAGFFSWFGNSETEVISSQTSSLAYLGTVALNHSPILTKSEQVIVADNFLLANKSPNAKIAKPLVIAQELFVPMTAYSSTVDQTDSDPFTTAWGTQVRDGIVAANFLPLGTKIKIPAMFGDKIFVVEDRMNKRYWQKVDIWFPERAQALNFGYRVLKIQILGS